MTSILEGLKVASQLIVKICGGTINKFQVVGKKEHKLKQVEFDLNKFKKIIGFSVSPPEIKKILNSLGFKINVSKNKFKVIVPSWRPDITQDIDLVEEIVRIKGFDKIGMIEPKKTRDIETLNFQQKLFHLSQRAVANKGFLETVTWSFTDEQIDNLLSNVKDPLYIQNPISSDLNVLRRSIFSNLLFYLKKNQDRGFKDISLFEIGPIFFGKKPGEQEVVLGGIRSGELNAKNWSEKKRKVDIFDVKADVLKTLQEIGLSENDLVVINKSSNCYHPGRSASVKLKNENGLNLVHFGEIHPSIISKLDFKEKNIYGFEIFLKNIPEPEKKLRVLKSNFKISDFQISERDFAFVMDKEFQVGKINNIILRLDNDIRSVNIFDVFEGGNLPEGKKSVAINVIIQSDNKTLSESDLSQISKKIIQEVEKQTGGKIRS